MVYALHKFRHFLLGNKFVLYVDHIAMIYLVNKPQVPRRIAKQLLLFLEYEFTIVYKPSRTHVVVDVLSRLLDSSKPLGVQDQTMDRCIIIFCRTYMDARNKRLLRNKSNAKNSELNPKTKIGQKGRTLYFKRGNSVQSGTRQQNVQIF